MPNQRYSFQVCKSNKEENRARKAPGSRDKISDLELETVPDDKDDGYEQKRENGELCED